MAIGVAIKNLGILLSEVYSSHLNGALETAGLVSNREVTGVTFSAFQQQKPRTTPGPMLDEGISQYFATTGPPNR